MVSLDGLLEVVGLELHASRIAGNDVNIAPATAVRLTNSRRVILCIPTPSEAEQVLTWNDPVMAPPPAEYVATSGGLWRDRKSVGEGKRVDLGGRRIIKDKRGYGSGT